MTAYTLPGVRVFAGYDDAGNPRQIIPHQAQIWATEVERGIVGASAGRVDAVTWADLNANPGTREGQPGRVVGPDTGTHTDPVIGGTVANEGEYVWSTTPAGWRRTGDLPAELIRATNTNSGNPNAITADTSAALPRADWSALIALNILAENTQDAPTVEFNNDGTDYTITDAVGTPVSAGGLSAGMLLNGYIVGTTFRVDMGPRGWSPLFETEPDGEREVLKLYDWTGGHGAKPNETGYVGPNGLTQNIADATNIRGKPGPNGPGTGDMLESVYDPTFVEGDAFDRVNHHGPQTIAALTAVPKARLRDGESVFVSNYADPNDGGGGWFNWEASRTTDADGGVIFEADEGGVGRWVRNTAPYASNVILLRWYGLKLTLTADRTNQAICEANAAHNDAALVAAHHRLRWQHGTILFPRQNFSNDSLLDLRAGGFYDFRQRLDFHRIESGNTFAAMGITWDAEGGAGYFTGSNIRFIGSGADVEETLTVLVDGAEHAATTATEYTSCWLRIPGAQDVKFRNLNFLYASDLFGTPKGGDLARYMVIVDGEPYSGLTSTFHWLFSDCQFTGSDGILPPAGDVGAYMWVLNTLMGEFDQVKFEVPGDAAYTPNTVRFGQWQTKIQADFPDPTYRPIAGGVATLVRWNGGWNLGTWRWRALIGLSVNAVEFAKLWALSTMSRAIEENEDQDATYGASCLGRNFTFRDARITSNPAFYASSWMAAKHLHGLTFDGTCDNIQLPFIADGDSDAWDIKLNFDTRLATKTASQAAGFGGGVFYALVVNAGAPAKSSFKARMVNAEIQENASDPVDWGNMWDRRNPGAERGVLLVNEMFTTAQALTPGTWTSLSQLASTITHRGGDVVVTAKATVRNDDAATQLFYMEVLVNSAPTDAFDELHIDPADRDTLNICRRIPLAVGQNLIQVRVWQSGGGTPAVVVATNVDSKLRASTFLQVQQCETH